MKGLVLAIWCDDLELECGEATSQVIEDVFRGVWRHRPLSPRFEAPGPREGISAGR